MKKKVFASLLAAAMVLSLCACGQKNVEPPKDEPVKDEAAKEVIEFNIGYINDLFNAEAFIEHKEEAHSEEEMWEESGSETYSNLSAALLAMENEKITAVSVSKSAADYIVAHNDKFQAIALTKGASILRVHDVKEAVEAVALWS